jgi:hypothetical protein
MLDDGRIKEIRCKITAFGSELVVVLPDGREVAAGEALRLVKGSKKTGGGPKGPASTLPKKTLVREDFEGGEEARFKARVVQVSDSLGDTNIRGRILTLKGLGAGKGFDTIQAWWEAANPTQKTRLLMDGGRFQELLDGDSGVFSDSLGTPSEGLVKLWEGTQCPFQGDLRPKVGVTASGDSTPTN